jgi:hypothetical protein
VVYGWALSQYSNKRKDKKSLFLTNNFQSGVAEDSRLSECYAEPLGEKLPTFRKIVVTSSSVTQYTKLELPELPNYTVLNPRRRQIFNKGTQ